MSRIQGFILYRIYYGGDIVYLGRTKQPLQDRIRGHLFQKPMHRNISIDLVTKIEYAMFQTEADMNVYEVYFINLYHPVLNVDDKARDGLTIELPEIEWIPFKTSLWDKWRKQIADKDAAYEDTRKRKIKAAMKMREMRKLHHEHKISEEEYLDFIDRVAGK